MNQDKTTFGVSEELRQYIEALVEEVVLEGKPFEDHKKYLQRFCQTEDVDYSLIETNLGTLFETVEELMAHESKGNERLLQLLAKECYISHDVINKIISVINAKRRELEEEEARRRAEEEARRKREAEERAKAEREAQAKAKKAREKAERERKAEKAKQEAERKVKEAAQKKKEEELAVMSRKNQKYLAELPFCEFPSIQEELMTFTGRDDFYTTYLVGYRRILDETLRHIENISYTFKKAEVKQDNEFAEFSEDAYKFLERARSAKCCEIEAIHNEGEALQTRGREIRERVAFINAKAKHDKEVKKCAIRAIIFTVITAVSSIYFITNFKKVYRYVSGLPSFYKLSLEFLIFMLLLGGIIGILTFWDLFYEEMNDELFMRKKKEFMNKYKK